jgi:hypothetical protein
VKATTRSRASATAFALVLVATTTAAATPEIDAARDRGFAWLLSQQQRDGNWSASPGVEVVATATALEALRLGGVGGASPILASQFLANSPAPSVDSLARKTLALAGAGRVVDAFIDELLARRNTGLAWGAYDGFGTSFPDTTLALAALRVGRPSFSTAETQTALCAVLVARRPSGAGPDDGAWAFGPWNDAKRVLLPTALNIVEVETNRTLRGWATVTCGSTPYSLGTAVNEALDWMIAQRRNADGGFGENGTSTVLETAVAYEALSLVRPGDAATAGALSFLMARQGGDGGWNGDVLATAYVLRVLPPRSAAYVDTDGDGIPDAIETVLGRNPLVAEPPWLVQGSGGSGTGGAADPQSVRSGVRASTLPPAEAVADGDLNEDGIVDAADIAIAERIALGVLAPTATYLRHGDVAGGATGGPDGQINVADVAKIRLKVLGLESF